MKKYVVLGLILVSGAPAMAQMACREPFSIDQRTGTTSGGFASSDALRAYRLVGVDLPYREVLRLNHLEFVSEEPIDRDPRNGYLIYIRYKGQEVSFTATPSRHFTSKAQQAIEGAVRAIEMTLDPRLIPSNATASTRFRSSALLRRLPVGVQRWLVMERDRLSRDVDTKLTKGFSPSRNFQEPAFRPEAGRVFEIEGHWLSEDKITMFRGSATSTDLPERFVRIRNGKREYLFLIHPESREYYRDLVSGVHDVETYLATSTASSRSMVVWKEGFENRPFVAKLSLDRQIGNIVRLIDEHEIKKSMAVDMVMEQTTTEFGPENTFIREVAAMLPNGQHTGGLILRELPSEMFESSDTQAPLFALYGTSQRHPVPLLVEMIRRSGVPTAEFVRLNVIRPLVEFWVRMALNGVVLEPHAQNALIRLDRDMMPTGRFVYRDNGGFTVDVEVRRRRGLHLPPQDALAAPINEIFDRAEHGNHYSLSLAKFMEGGFLSQIEAKSKEWERSGVLPGGGLPDGYVRETLAAEVERAVLRMTGIRIRLNRDWSDLNSTMRSVVDAASRH